MAFVVIAKWTAKEGEESAVAEAVSKLAGPSRQEPGNRLYLVHRDPNDTRVFFFYEQYRDEAGYEAHTASEHFRRYGVGEALPRMESRERKFYETWDV